MIIGLTGGVGSGKSTVADLLVKKYDFSLLSTDDIAKKVMAEDSSVRRKLCEVFGSEIYDACGKLDRKKYSSCLYAAPENKELSDSIIHPAVWSKVKAEIARLQAEYGKEKNILIETAIPGNVLTELSDEVWYVYVDPSERIRRLSETRGYTEEYSRRIMQNQPSDEEYFRDSDRVLNNNGTLEEMEEQIALLMEEIQK